MIKELIFQKQKWSTLPKSFEIQTGTNIDWVSEGSTTGNNDTMARFNPNAIAQKYGGASTVICDVLGTINDCYFFQVRGATASSGYTQSPLWGSRKTTDGTSTFTEPVMFGLIKTNLVKNVIWGG